MTEPVLLDSRILIVDDLPANLRLLEELLAREGFTNVVSTTEPEQVLELHRGQERFTPPLADRPLREGDRLLLRCTRADLLRLQQEH